MRYADNCKQYNEKLPKLVPVTIGEALPTEIRLQILVSQPNSFGLFSPGNILKQYLKDLNLWSSSFTSLPHHVDMRAQVPPVVPLVLLNIIKK